MTESAILVNRAPVLTLWAATVAERLGHDRAAALTLGKAVAGLNAQSKGRRLGIYEAPKPEPGAARAHKRRKPAPESVALLGRLVPVVVTRDGVRALVKDRAESPASVERYLQQKFGSALSEVEQALRALARSYPKRELAEEAYGLYEQFRPVIPEGVKGWGAKGRLDLGRIAALGKGGDQQTGKS
jgi:hypothetical protein